MGRPRTGPPLAVLLDAKTVRLLGDAMRRAKPSPLPSSFRLQTCAVVRCALAAMRNGLGTISPTVAQLAKAAKCQSRQARVNLRTLEAWGVLVRRAEGGGSKATTYAFDGEALFWALVTIKCQPGDDLRKGLRSPETHRYRPLPRQSPPAVTPAVEERPTPAVAYVFPL